MEDEWEQIDLVTGKAKEVDLDLILDPSMYGRYRMEQIRRWQEQPGYFMYRDITALSAADLLTLRRKELMKKQFNDFKEGTNVAARTADGDAGQEEDQL